MRKNKEATKRSISELVNWFEKTDTGDFLQQMPEIQFDVDIKSRRHLVELEPELAARVSKLAKAKKVSSQSLINAWVRDKVSDERPRQ